MEQIDLTKRMLDEYEELQFVTSAKQAEEVATRNKVDDKLFLLNLFVFT